MSEAEMSLPAVARAACADSAADLAARAYREASRALFALAFLQLGFTTLMALMRQFLGATVEPNRVVLELVLAIGFAVAFVGLGVWARFKTLPAAVLGLALYVVFALLNIALGLVLILLAALLVKAIRTCLKARQG